LGGPNREQGRGLAMAREVAAPARFGLPVVREGGGAALGGGRRGEGPIFGVVVGKDSSG
jgi:hypothetical protein